MITSTKAVYVTQLPDALIIQLNIFKYIGGINKKLILNLSIDEKIMFWGSTMVLSGVIYHEGQESDCGHYTAGVHRFSISDTKVLRQKFQFNPRDIGAPYIRIYEGRGNLLIPPSSLLNDATGIPSSDSTPDFMIWQSVIKELENKNNYCSGVRYYYTLC